MVYRRCLHHLRDGILPACDVWASGCPDSKVTGFGALSVVLGLAIAGPALAGFADRLPDRLGTDWKVPKKVFEGVATILRLLTLLGVFVALILLVIGYRGILWDMVSSRPIPLASYLLFSFLFGWIPWRTIRGIEMKRIPAGEVRTAWILALCLVIPTYYLILMTFSYAVFPYIPAIRGGGDYTVAPMVVVHLKSSAPPQVPNGGSLPNENLRASASTLLEETATALFVASPTDAGGPCEWRSHSDRRPQILSISRDAVAGVDYVSSANGYMDCGSPRPAPTSHAPTPTSAAPTP